jgi:hypothetical protein
MTRDTCELDPLTAEDVDDSRALVELRGEWDRRRNSAATASERSEIDAMFARVMP